MDILPRIFRSCKVCGIWYEDSSYLLLKILYGGLVGFILVQFFLSELIELTRSCNSLREASELLFATFNFISCFIKVLNLVSRRRTMHNLVKDFQLAICQPRSPEEEAIINSHSCFISKLFLGYCSLTLSTGVLVSSVPLLGHEPKLPYRGYQVVDVSGPVGFGVVCSLQLIAVFYVILISTTLDSMAVSFMILAAGQVEVNYHRIVNSSMPLRRCIEHQILMSGTVHKIQNFFIPAVVPQFFFSLVTLCTSIFLMSQIPVTEAEFVSFSMCVISMTTQVFVYCWFGNELKLKSQKLADAVYTSNWINCDKKERKNLWLVVLYAKRATMISFHGQSGLTLDTFIWISKTAYAAFNLLRKSTN